MKKISCWLFLFLWLSANSSLAKTVIKAECDKLKILLGDTLTYKIIITTSERKVPPPKIPTFEGFEVLSNGQSSSVSFSENTVQTNMIYFFILSPKGPGKYRIEPVEIKIKNQIYESESFEIEVIERAEEDEIHNKPSLPGRKNLPETKEMPQITL